MSSKEAATLTARRIIYHRNNTFCTQIEVKMTYLVFVFCYLLSLHL